MGDEQVVYSWIEWPSKEHHDAVWPKIMADERTEVRCCKRVRLKIAPSFRLRQLLGNPTGRANGQNCCRAVHDHSLLCRPWYQRSMSVYSRNHISNGPGKCALGNSVRRLHNELRHQIERLINS